MPLFSHLGIPTTNWYEVGMLIEVLVLFSFLSVTDNYYTPLLCCLKKNQSAPRPSEHPPLLFLTFSVLVANPKKTTLHGGQSRSWSAEQGKKKRRKKEEKSLAAPPPSPPSPPPLPRCSSGENKNKKSRDASTCLGATQVGVTQVVSVRLASVQGFLRLVD